MLTESEKQGRVDKRKILFADRELHIAEMLFRSLDSSQCTLMSSFDVVSMQQARARK